MALRYAKLSRAYRHPPVASARVGRCSYWMASRKATAYIGLVVAAGAITLAFGVWDWQTRDWVRYLSFCVVALIASGMKVPIPSVASGTMSVSFVFVLIGIAELSLPETLAMGCFGMLVQCVFHARNRPRPVQVLFSVASVACSIDVSYALFHTLLRRVPSIEIPILLLLASGAYFLTNTMSVAAVIGLTEKKNVWSVWRGCYLWTFPNYLAGAAVAWAISAASRLIGWQVSLLLLPVLYFFYRSHASHVNRLEEAARLSGERRLHAEEVAALHRRTIEVLALAVEAKDQTTHDHLQRVEIYAVELGKDLGLSETEIEALRAAALLHDIGKLGVPEYIVSKPGKLTPDEFEKMKTHTLVGAEIVEQVRFPYPVAPIVRSHHEKWNGLGYPDGLSGERIPIGARILAAVDCLDALSSDRQYRRALPLDEAIKIVEAESGKSYDPRVVEVLVKRYVELERLAKSCGRIEIKLSTGAKIERGDRPAAGFESSSSGLINLHGELAAAEDRTSRLSEFERMCESAADRDALYAVLRQSLPALVPYEAMALYLVRAQAVEPACADGEEYREFVSVAIPLGTGLSGWVAENGKSILNGNPSVEPGYLGDPAKFDSLRSALAVPLETANGVAAVLSLYRRERDAFTGAELKLLVAVGSRLARALERTEDRQRV